MPQGKTSLGFRLRYRHAKRTLVDKEVDAAQTKALDRLSRELGAVLR